MIRLLRHEPLKLEAIAKSTGFPKASLLRLLDTLSACGVVSRAPKTMHYSLLQDLVQMAPGRVDFASRRQELLEQLSRLAGATCEWYEWRDGAPEICARVEDQQAAIRVKAQLGFRRTLGDELEAVAQVFYRFAPPTQESFWIWSEGVQTKLGKIQITAKLKQVEKLGCGVDHDSNIHGIARLAVPVCDERGRLRAIVALVRPFHPRLEGNRQESLFLLKNAVENLSSILPDELPVFPATSPRKPQKP